MTWQVNEQTLRTLSESDLWQKFALEFIGNATFSHGQLKTPYDVAKEIFGNQLGYLGRTWGKEHDVFKELFMNMGGGLPFDVLVEARNCMKLQDIAE